MPTSEIIYEERGLNPRKSAGKNRKRFPQIALIVADILL
jgi:hypothetical protein